MWVTASNEECLKTVAGSDASYVDTWSQLNELPDYVDYGDGSTRTRILLPLEYGERVFGVLNLELDEHTALNERGKDRLRRLAASLARLIWLHRTSQTQSQHTRRAVKELESVPVTFTSPLKMPSVFLSTPATVDDEVVDLILSVLKEQGFAQLFEVKYWKEESLSGDIKQQVRDGLVASEFGVCYLSQLGEEEGGQPRFVDNPNVIFEAGMLQAVHEMKHAGSATASWIPVRESEPFANPLPFNFATDRVVLVPRDPETGALQEQDFKDRLRKCIEAEVERRSLG